MSLTPKAGTLAGFNLSGLLGDQDASALANNTGLFDSGGLSVPPFASGLALQQSASFTPNQISGLSVWLRGDVGLNQAAGNVTLWSDQSGNGNDFSANLATVSYTASSVGGKPAATFAGGNLLCPSSVLGAGSARTVYAVVRANNPSAAQILTFRRGTTFWQMLYGSTGATFASLAFTDGVNPTCNATLSPGIGVHGVPYVIALTAPTAGVGVFMSEWINGVAQTLTGQTFGWVAETGAAGIQLGGGVGVTSNFSGDISEILVYAGSHTAGQVAQVTAYERAKYGF